LRGDDESKEPQAAELERLRAENEELRGRAGEPGGHFWASFLATVLLSLFCVVAVAAGFASWLHYTALDTPRFVEAVAPLVRDETVARALSEEAVERLFAQFHLAEQIEKQIGRLPEPFKSQAATGSAGARGLAVTVATDVLKSNAFQSAWRAILTASHTEAVKGLRSSGAVRLDEQGKVILDITDLLTGIKNRLASIGITFLRDRKIPGDLGQVVLYQNSQLGVVKTAVNALDDLFLILPICAVVLLTLGALVAHDTRRAMTGASVGLIALVVLLYAGIEITRGHFTGRLVSASTRGAATAISNHLLQTFYAVLIGLLVLGALTALAAALSGPYRWAEKLHGIVSLSGIRRRMNPGLPAGEPLLRQFAWPLRITGLATALLLFWYLPWASAAVVLIVCAAYLLLLLAVEFLR